MVSISRNKLLESNIDLELLGQLIGSLHDIEQGKIRRVK